MHVCSVHLIYNLVDVACYDWQKMASVHKSMHVHPHSIYIIYDRDRLRKTHYYYYFDIAETRESKEMTEQSDIYGLGLVLIELLTGKSPADMEFGAHENIVEWARYCYSECHLDGWIDTMIRGHATNHIHKEMVETMNLALHCTATDPTARPSATDVFKTLDSFIRPTSCVSILKFS